jgi:hypothetical protein
LFHRTRAVPRSTSSSAMLMTTRPSKASNTKARC